MPLSCTNLTCLYLQIKDTNIILPYQEIFHFGWTKCSYHTYLGPWQNIPQVLPKVPCLCSKAPTLKPSGSRAPRQTLRTKLLAHPCFSNPNSKHLSSNCCETLHHDNVHVIVHQILIPSSYYAINTHPIRSSLIIFIFDSLWVFPFLNCHTRSVTFCLEPPHIKTSLSLDLVINTQVDIQLSQTNWSIDLHCTPSSHTIDLCMPPAFLIWLPAFLVSRKKMQYLFGLKDSIKIYLLITV